MKIVFGVPTTGFIHYRAHMSMVGILRSMPNAAAYAKAGLLPMVREDIFAYALREKADFLVMHDSDMVVETRAMSGLIEMMECNERCAIAGVLYLKNAPRVPVFMMPHPQHGQWDGAFVPELVQAVHKVPSWPFQVAVVGTGFSILRMAAALDLLEKEGSPLWRMDVRNRRNGWPKTHATEDTDLCLRFAKYDWESWALPQYDTVHLKEIGHLNWNRDEWEKQSSYDLDPVTNARMVEVGGIVCMDMTPLAPQPAGPKLVATE